MDRSLARGTLALLLVALSGCAALDEELARREPTATVESTRLAALGFESAELVLDVRIDNPNPVGVELAGFDYALRLAGSRLLSGERDARTRIPADGSGRVEVPLRLGYEEVYAALGALAGRDAVDYAVELGLRVDVPLLGTRELPLSASGRLPLPRRPRVELRSLRLDALDWDGARLVLDLGVDNPNAFGLALRELRYRLVVDGTPWGGGSGGGEVEIPAGASGRVTLPLELDFDTIGRGAYRALTGSDELAYTLEGSVAGVAGHELLGGFDVSFTRSGRLPALR